MKDGRASCKGTRHREAEANGLDIGTTSAKVAAFDADGEMHDRRERVYGPDADADAIVRGALELLPDGPVGLSAAMHSVIGLDARDRPCTPLLKWSDGRALEQADRIRREHPDLHARTGTPIHPMSPLAKLAWFADAGVTAARWVGLKELVLHRLTGEWVVDHSVASGTGLLALRTLDWDEEALAVAGVDADQLSRPVPATTRFGDLVIGAGDGPLANLGLGATAPGIAACSIGTSGALRVTVPAPTHDPRLFCYALTPGSWVVGGATSNGGNVLGWLADRFGTDAATLFAELPSDSAGLVVRPLLWPERAPDWDARGTATIEGLTHRHTRGHLVRASLEGICRQLRLVLDAVRGAGHPVTEVRATGGLLRSEACRGILADALAVPISFPAVEASALGAARLALEV